MIVFYDDDYVAAGSSFDTVSKAALVADSLCVDPVAGVVLRSPEPVGREELHRIHDPAYVRAVTSGWPFELAGSSGLTWDRGLARSVFASTGGCRDAAAAAWTDGVAGSLSSGLHHARRAAGEGFCTLNGVALAALTFCDLGARSVLVLDLDAHCGGGTNDILGGDGRIVQIDVSTDRFDAYTPTVASTLDIVEDSTHYLATITRRLDEATSLGFDAVVYNAGMDPHERCGTGGLDGIADAILAERERLVFDWATGARAPIMFVLAGGYSAGAMGTEHLTWLHRLTITAAARSAAA